MGKRAGSAGRSRNQSQTKIAGKLQGGVKGYVPFRSAVYQYTPDALRYILEAALEENDPPPDGDSQDDENVTDDVDMGDENDDEGGEMDAVPQMGMASGIDSDICKVGETISFRESPTLEFQRIYSITVTPGRDGRFECRFEAPAWFYGNVARSYNDYVRGVEDFISGVGKWFEDNRQEFLKNPGIKGFIGEIKYDRGSYGCPIVTQKGFVDAVSDYVQNPAAHGSVSGNSKSIRREGGEAGNLEESSKKNLETYLSKIMDKIYFLWPDFSVPLESLFSYEMRVAWAVQFCMQSGGSGGWVLRDDSVRSIPRKELSALRGKRFEDMTQLQILHLSAKLVRVEEADIIRGVAHATLAKGGE